MSGVLCAMASIGSNVLVMTVGSTTYTFGGFTNYYDGFIGTDSQSGVSSIGSLSPIAYKDSTVAALYAQSLSGHTANAILYVEFTGNRSAGYFSEILVNGSDIVVSISAPSYSAGLDTTRFSVATNATNPFGTSGTKSIVIS